MSYTAPLRDRIAVRICNAVMRVLATEHYRKMVAGSITYGLRAAARDEQSGALPPLPESACVPSCLCTRPGAAGCDHAGQSACCCGKMQATT